MAGLHAGGTLVAMLFTELFEDIPADARGAGPQAFEIGRGAIGHNERVHGSRDRAGGAYFVRVAGQRSLIGNENFRAAIWSRRRNAREAGLAEIVPRAAVPIGEMLDERIAFPPGHGSIPVARPGSGWLGVFGPKSNAHMRDFRPA